MSGTRLAAPGSASVPARGARAARRTEIERLLAAESHNQRRRLVQAALLAALVGAATVLLLGLSGWFITASALAGGAGLVAAHAFNTLLPSACIRLLAILRTAGRYGERLVGHDAALRMMARIRPALYRALAAGPVKDAMALSLGDAAARLVQDVDEVEASVVRRPALGSAAAACGAGLGAMLASGAATLAVGAVLAAALLAAGRWLSRASTRAGRAIPAAQGRLKQEFASIADAAAELRVYGLEDWAAGELDRVAGRLLRAQQRMALSLVRVELLLGAATGVAAMAALAMAMAGRTVALHPAAAAAARAHAAPASAVLARAALAALGAAAMTEGLAGLVRAWQARGSLQAARARLDLMLAPPPALAPALAPAPAGPADPVVLAERPAIVFGLLDARLLPGTFTGLQGPSGCGKTSLIETLVGLREPADRSVLLDGRALCDITPGARRRCFSLAPQAPGLLAGTVRDNLRLADPQASEAALWDALWDAGLDERVRRLPGGLECWLGEGGTRLSSGEQRRLALARAYLRPAPWLLLDEPTAGLNARTEQLVISRLRPRVTRTRQGVLLVSHAAAPLAACDDVLTFGHHREPEPARVA